MVKNKGGDLTDANNYRAIALSNVESKIFEAIILCKVAYVLTVNMMLLNLALRQATLLVSVFF